MRGYVLSMRNENPDIEESNMDLKRILNAQSVAIIGASRDERKRGYQAIKTLLNEKYANTLQRSFF